MGVRVRRKCHGQRRYPSRSTERASRFDDVAQNSLRSPCHVGAGGGISSTGGTPRGSYRAGSRMRGRKSASSQHASTAFTSMSWGDVSRLRRTPRQQGGDGDAAGLLAAPLPKLRHRPAPREQGITPFFTGLSGSGKSTLAKIMYGKFVEEDRRSVKRRVMKDRTVSLNGRLYEVDAVLVGETVTLRYDPDAAPSHHFDQGHSSPRRRQVSRFRTCFSSCHRSVQASRPLDARKGVTVEVSRHDNRTPCQKGDPCCS